MEQVDEKVFTLISMGVLFAISALKRGFPNWVGGKEEFLALVLPVAFTIAAKVLGAFKATDWVSALIAAIGAGLAAQYVHDKVVNPVVKFKAELKADAEAAK